MIYKKLVQKVKESDLVKSVLDYLAVKKIFAIRNNTGSFVRDSHFYRFGSVGSPDIWAIKPITEYNPNKSGQTSYYKAGQIYGIECKVKGRKQSLSQLQFQKEFERAGGRYILVYKIEDVEKALEL